MGILRASRMLGRLEDGLMSSAQLETMLATTAGKSDFGILLSQRGQVSRMAGVAATAAAVCGSSTALDMILQQSLILDRFIGNEVALAAAMGSSTFAGKAGANWSLLSALISNPANLLPMWGSDAWLSAIAGMMSSVAAHSAATTTAPAAPSAQYASASFGFYRKVILLWMSHPTVSPAIINIDGRRAGSTIGTISGFSIYVGAYNVMALESNATMISQTHCPGTLSVKALLV